MSLVKAQIPDGYATIRSRGLHRWRSQALESRPVIMHRPIVKYDSGPLFENNNDLFYGKDEVLLSSLDALPTTDHSPYAEPTKLKTMSSFKGFDSLAQSNEQVDVFAYNLMLPPLKSPQYINELNAIRSHHANEFETKSQSSNGISGMSLYSRPDSPRYSKIGYRSSTSDSSETGSSSPTYLNHRIPISTLNGLNNNNNAKLTDHHGYVNTAEMRTLVTSKPPIKTASALQYRKSFSHASKVIYEETSFNRLNNNNNGGGNKIHHKMNGGHNSATTKAMPAEKCNDNQISHYHKIHENASSELLNLDIIPKQALINKVVNGYDRRRYATLGGHQYKDRFNNNTTTSLYNLNKSTVSLSDDSLYEHYDPLDYKVGCQTMLRSKPVIPWYELAIKRDHRQSCPPFQAHVVSAFEQSLSNMTSRLQSITATTEKKDSEILEMRQTIELLRKQSIQAGLTTAHMQSMGVPVNNQKAHTASSTPKTSSSNSVATSSNDQTTPPPLAHTNGAQMHRHHSSESMCSLNSVSSSSSAQEKKKKKGWLRSSFSKAFSRNAKISKTNRQNQHHHQHLQQQQMQQQQQPEAPIYANTAMPDTHSSLPPQSPTHKPGSLNSSPHKTAMVVEHNGHRMDASDTSDSVHNNPLVEELKKQLREKDLVLTDIRLEALSSASQLESLKDTVMKMRQEMMNLKQNNERLQRLVTSRSLAGSEASLSAAAPLSPSGSMSEPRRYSLAGDAGMTRQHLELPKNLDELDEENIPPAPAPEPPPEPLSPAAIAQLSPSLDRPSLSTEILCTPAEDVADPIDGKKISIAVYLGQPESFAKYAEELLTECDTFSSPARHPLNEVDAAKAEMNGTDTGASKSFSDPSPNEFVIAYTYISGKTTWQNLDYIVRKTFKDYLSRIDPGTNLGLNTDSITSYHLGEAKRGPEMGFPELLPCGYIIGNVKALHICLQGVGSLAFECLIPRSIVHRYISLLTEHRRLILCGPSGTGKSFLARKLAEFLVAKSGRESLAEAIATFNVDHKSSKELQQYLSHVAEQASMSNGEAEELPSVIILDNLHHASALGDVFACLLSCGGASKLPCIIGTMSQATCNTTNLQLHHNFRWVLTANHMEPVKGFLARYLRRRLFTLELTTQSKQPQLEKVYKWLPNVWQHINSFLETHSSSDVTIGPRLFLSCPLELNASQVWFTDVWNYHLAPYLVEAIREGVQLYGRRGGTWVDPCTFVRETYPWPVGPTTVPTLRQITADDVGLEAQAPSNGEAQDPLLNMLMRLQEAANYNGNQEQDSDCASLDSNLTHDSSAGVEYEK